MLTLERARCLVNEYLTFHVPRTTLGTRQGGFNCVTNKKRLFICPGRCEKIQRLRVINKTSDADGLTKANHSIYI